MFSDDPASLDNFLPCVCVVLLDLGNHFVGIFESILFDQSTARFRYLDPWLYLQSRPYLPNTTHGPLQY